MTIDKEREKIKWACRRGMLECDLFLVPFFEHCFDTLSPDEKTSFVDLLAESDTDLIAWLMQQATPSNPSYHVIINKIRTFKLSNP